MCLVGLVDPDQTYKTFIHTWSSKEIDGAFVDIIF